MPRRRTNAGTTLKLRKDATSRALVDDRGGHRDSVIRDNAGSALKSLDQVTIPLLDHE